MRKNMKWIIMALIVGLALPVMASEKEGASALNKEQVQKELQAMKERSAQTICPISGKAIVEGKGFEYKGYFIGTCCPNCAKAVEKAPLQAIMKTRQNGEEPQLAEGFSKQDRCPMSGKPAQDEFIAVKNNMLLKFCCPNCPAGFEKDPKGVMGKLMENKAAPIILTMEQKSCPISGHPIVDGMSVTAKGKEIGLCCAGCKDPVAKNPEKYIQALADAGVVLPDAK